MGNAGEAKTAAVPPSPLAPSARFTEIDVLRGVALFGVMAMNLVFEFRVSIFERFLPETEAASPLDQAVKRFLLTTVDLKAFALFSLLFGIGLAIQFDRLPENRRAILLLRRLAVLLAVGLLHIFLVWNGDILAEYALVGFVALPFLFGPSWLLAATSLLFLTVYVAMPPLVPLPDHAWLADDVAAARQIYATGNFAEVLAFRMRELPGIIPLHLAVFPRTLALFLLGALIWRSGVLQRRSDNMGLLFGIASVAGLALTVLAAGTNLVTVTLALSYGALILALMRTRLGARLLGWAAPLGRMAFTNYLAQSLIFGLVFDGYGLGLFGKIGASAALAFGIAVYAAQAIFSRWWLKHHNFGPVEWLWRSLMYGTPQPMRLAKAAA